MASWLLKSRGGASHLRDELEDAGYLGLVEAAGKYRPDRGAFRAFAEFRVRGAMLDALRGRDLMGRHYRDLVRSGLTPKVTVVAVEIGGTEAELALKLTPVGGESPEDAADRALLRDQLLAALATLTDQERECVAGVLRGDRLQEIGARWGRSEARACQVWLSALRKMRSLASRDG